MTIETNEFPFLNSGNSDYFPRALERVARAVGAFEGVALVPDAATRAATRCPPGVLVSLTSLPSGIVGSAAALRFLAVAGVAAGVAFAVADDAGAFEEARLDADFLGVALAVAAGAAAGAAAADEAVERRLARRGVALVGSVSLSLQPPASLAGDSGCREASRESDSSAIRASKRQSGKKNWSMGWQRSITRTGERALGKRFKCRSIELNSHRACASIFLEM